MVYLRPIAHDPIEMRIERSRAVDHEPSLGENRSLIGLALTWIRLFFVRVLNFLFYRHPSSLIRNALEKAAKGPDSEPSSFKEKVEKAFLQAGLDAEDLSPDAVGVRLGGILAGVGTFYRGEPARGQEAFKALQDEIMEAVQKTVPGGIRAQWHPQEDHCILYLCQGTQQIAVGRCGISQVDEAYQLCWNDDLDRNTPLLASASVEPIAPKEVALRDILSVAQVWEAAPLLTHLDLTLGPYSTWPDWRLQLLLNRLSSCEELHLSRNTPFTLPPMPHLRTLYLENSDENWTIKNQPQLQKLMLAPQQGVPQVDLATCPILSSVVMLDADYKESTLNLKEDLREHLGANERLAAESSNHHTPTSLTDLAKYAPFLELVELRGESFSEDLEGLKAALAQCGRCTRLILHGIELDELPTMHSLQHLILHDCPQLAKTGTQPSLKEIWTSGSTPLHARRPESRHSLDVTQLTSRDALSRNLRAHSDCTELTMRPAQRAWVAPQGMLRLSKIDSDGDACSLPPLPPISCPLLSAAATAPTSKSLVEWLRAAPGLTEVNLSDEQCQGWGPAGLHYFLSLCVRCTQLQLTDCELSTLPTMPALTSLTLKSCKGLTTISNQPQLRDLTLTGSVEVETLHSMPALDTVQPYHLDLYTLQDCPKLARSLSHHVDATMLKQPSAARKQKLIQWSQSLEKQRQVCLCDANDQPLPWTDQILAWRRFRKEYPELSPPCDGAELAVLERVIERYQEHLDVLTCLASEKPFPDTSRPEETEPAEGLYLTNTLTNLSEEQIQECFDCALRLHAGHEPGHTQAKAKELLQRSQQGDFLLNCYLYLAKRMHSSMHPQPEEHKQEHCFLTEYEISADALYSQLLRQQVKDLLEDTHSNLPSELWRAAFLFQTHSVLTRAQEWKTEHIELMKELKMDRENDKKNAIQKLPFLKRQDISPIEKHEKNLEDMLRAWYPELIHSDLEALYKKYQQDFSLLAPYLPQRDSRSE